MRLGLTHWGLVFGVAMVTAGCSDDGTPEDTGSDTTGSTTAESATTLPVTSISITDGETAEPSTTGDDSDAGTGPGQGTTGQASDTDGTGASDTDAATDTDGSTGATGSTGTTGGPAYVVQWCILQSPAEIMTGTDTDTTVYARLYVEGVTDQTEFVDENPAIVSEFGYGADGSDPAVDAWTWIDGEPNPGWDGTMAPRFGSENNDEYQADLSFSETGTYDYAARFSADGGDTWVYCDLNDSQMGGYTSDQAGNAVIE